MSAFHAWNGWTGSKTPSSRSKSHSFATWKTLGSNMSDLNDGESFPEARLVVDEGIQGIREKSLRGEDDAATHSLMTLLLSSDKLPTAGPSSADATGSNEPEPIDHAMVGHPDPGTPPLWTPMDLLANVAAAEHEIIISTDDETVEEPAVAQSEAIHQLPIATTVVRSGRGRIHKALMADVILSQATGVCFIEQHVGNRRLLDLVQKYASQSKRHWTAVCKEQVAKTIHHTIVKSAGRFLCRHAEGFAEFRKATVLKYIVAELDKAIVGTNQAALQYMAARQTRSKATVGMEILEDAKPGGKNTSKDKKDTKSTTSVPTSILPAIPMTRNRRVRLLLAPRTPQQSGPMLEEPHPSDCIFGRGSSICYHPGNMNFRQIVWAHKREYNETKRRDTSAITKRVLDAFAATGGRFLQGQRRGDGRDMPADRIFEKAAQALCERKWYSLSTGANKRGRKSKVVPKRRVARRKSDIGSIRVR